MSFHHMATQYILDTLVITRQCRPNGYAQSCPVWAETGLRQHRLHPSAVLVGVRMAAHMSSTRVSPPLARLGQSRAAGSCALATTKLRATTVSVSGNPDAGALQASGVWW